MSVILSLHLRLLAVFILIVFADKCFGNADSVDEASKSILSLRLVH